MIFKNRCNTCRTYDCGDLCRCICHDDDKSVSPTTYGSRPRDGGEQGAMQGLASLFT